MNSLSDRTSQPGPKALVGKSIGNLLIAYLFTLFTLAFVLMIGLGKSDLGTLLFPAVLLGAASGFFVAGAAQARVFVRPGEIVLVNMLREITIEADAISRLELSSGMYVSLKDGRWYASTAFNPALGKRLFTRNPTARMFGTAAAEILGVPVDEDLPKQVASPFPGSVKIRIRVETLMYMLLFGVLSCGIALGSRGLT